MDEKICLLIVLICYFVPARIIFDYVYNASPVVIDEVFHLPIGVKYCQYNFTEWDDKITTLPGLYVFSTVLTAPLGVCTIYRLRYTVFVTSVINTGLIYFLRKQWVPSEITINRMLNTFNIVTLPPLLFFSMIYYTDVLSMMLVNAMILLGLRGQSFLASICGFMAMVTRQNNAIYILFIVGFRMLEHVYNIVTKTSSQQLHFRRWDARYLKIKWQMYLKEGIFTHNYSELLIEVLAYAVALIAMVYFVYINGGIVVGDRSAHTATVHIPQLFYFAVFVMFFCLPHACTYLLPFCFFLYRHLLLSALLLAVIVGAVQYNTHIHPYLLADNRHYLFYMWRYFLASNMQRLAACPIYLCALYCVARLCYRPSEPRFVIGYPIALLLVLCTQALVDVRYFLTPYVILRTFIAPTTRLDLLVEFALQAGISAFTLHTFGHKELHWTDVEGVQRIIW